tara:strand:- start:20 stop:904 length:885 start_codon:yes stop_codon:yes gene_type:complete
MSQYSINEFIIVNNKIICNCDSCKKNNLNKLVIYHHKKYNFFDFFKYFVITCIKIYFLWFIIKKFFYLIIKFIFIFIFINFFDSCIDEYDNYIDKYNRKKKNKLELEVFLKNNLFENSKIEKTKKPKSPKDKKAKAIKKLENKYETLSLGNNNVDELFEWIKNAKTLSKDSENITTKINMMELRIVTILKDKIHKMNLPNNKHYNEVFKIKNQITDISEDIINKSTIKDIIDKEILRLDKLPKCNICMSKPNHIALKPCNHKCICIECYKKIKECPICRGKINDYTDIFKIINC